MKQLFEKNPTSNLRIIFFFVCFLVVSVSGYYFFTNRQLFVIEKIFNPIYFYFPYLLGWSFLVASILFFFVDQLKGYKSFLDLIFGLLACLFSVSFFVLHNVVSAQIIWFFFLMLLSIVFYCRFFIPVIPISLQSKIKRIGIIISIGFFLIATYFRFLSNSTNSQFFQTILVGWIGFLLGLAFFSLVISILIWDGIEHLSIHWFTKVGFVLIFFPMLIWIISHFSRPVVEDSAWLIIPFTMYPILMGISSRNRSDTQRSVRLASYLLIFYGIVGLITIFFVIYLYSESPNSNFHLYPLLSGFFLLSQPFIFTLLSRKGKVIFQKDIKPQADHQNPQNFENEVALLPSIVQDFFHSLKNDIDNQYRPSKYHHYFFLESSKEFVAFPFNRKVSSDLKFPDKSEFVKLISFKPTPLFLSDFDNYSDELSSDKEKIILLGANVIIPIFISDQLKGWLALYLENKTEAETQTIIQGVQLRIDKFVKQISDYEFQVDLESRVAHMNILNRIVQGVNYTIALDDIYELIYTQTSQIISFDDFYIILRDQQTQSLNFVFNVEADERQFEKENTVISQIQSLERQVIDSGRGLLVNDYQDYCQQHEFPVFFAQIRNSIIVPLNTGAISNGCILIGERTKEKRYSQRQLDLLQSIADLVAGAIEKARLLEETEQYARQLSILNDQTKKLTSTLDIDELFSMILQISMEMVPCEQAYLILIDETSQELIYQGAFGVHEDYFERKKIPIENNTSYLIEVFKSQEPFLANANELLQNGYGDIKTIFSFSIESLLVIPMLIKGQTIGIIQLVNHKLQTGFSTKDQQLLSALAAQSAIALENVRLYRRTDQELAKRVDELSVMQKIDRELNISLDLKKAMEITLEWALRQSGCPTGWIALVQDGKIQIIASKDYSHEQIHQVENIYFSRLSETILHNPAQGSSPVYLRRDLVIDGSPDITTQVLLPILREEKIIAILLLDVPENKNLDENDMNFLTRLGEHASIAIINGQLFIEVQKANQAKSDFVSLVAHELKNPMTSIKGYAELLASGAVGTINDAQANFITTIRNNTDRMNTLVSDLNDLNKIEAGIMRIDSRPLIFEEVMSEIVRSTRKQIDEKQQTLLVDIEDDLPKIWADRNRLVQILLNLINNAHKYSPAKSEIRVIAEKTNKTPNFSLNNLMAHIMIIDQGTGISEQDKTMIFQKFFRSDDTNVRATTGTGLGLNITRSLVELQGGNIWFESEYGKGTTFHFTLPLVKDDFPVY